MSYYVVEKVNRVSQNARDENKTGTHPARNVPNYRHKRNVPKCRISSYSSPKCFAAL